jgi:nitrogen-specific signal transduction histidine kinase/DNA-binding response OmpR family regulator
MDVIVVASSEQSVQESLRVLLGDENVVTLAPTLPRLMSAIVEQPVDLVILDEFLENNDCVSVFQRLRTLAGDATCVMLAMSASSDMAREMRAKGVYDIVAKPFDKETLLACVARALERARLIKRVAAAEEAAAQMSSWPPVRATAAEESAVVQRREMLDSLRKFLKAVTDVFEPERLYGLILEAVVDTFSINRATLLLCGEEAGQMRIQAAVGLDRGLISDYAATPWTAIAAWLRRHDQILDPDGPEARIPAKEVPAVTKELEMLRARMCVPLLEEGRLIGALAVGKKVTGKRLSDPEIEFLCTLAGQIAAIIENARRHRAVFVQKERFEEILQGVTSGLMATDSDGRVTVFNEAAEQIFGLKASQALGRSVQRIGSVFADLVFTTLRDEKSLGRREVVDPATRKLLGTSTSLLTGPDKKPIGVVVLFTDLSALRRGGAGGEEDDWQRFALCMAQEIKNPLVAIRTFTQLFPESYADEKFRDEFSGIALTEIDKLDGIVERLLRFAQPLELRPAPGDIHSLLEEQIDRVAEEAKKKGVAIKKDFRFANGRVPFDRNLMSEALEQILDNALESMSSGGALSISTTAAVHPDPRSSNSDNGITPGKVAEILISDTGVGIPAEEMANLFKPFHSCKVKGMGLGLPISRRIIRGHRGDITISSEVDKGTTVKVVLPDGETQNGEDPGS